MDRLTDGDLPSHLARKETVIQLQRGCYRCICWLEGSRKHIAPIGKILIFHDIKQCQVKHFGASHISLHNWVTDAFLEHVRELRNLDILPKIPGSIELPCAAQKPCQCSWNYSVFATATKSSGHVPSLFYNRK